LSLPPTTDLHRWNERQQPRSKRATPQKKFAHALLNLLLRLLLTLAPRHRARLQPASEKSGTHTVYHCPPGGGRTRHAAER